jgi:hypothetical protein
LLRQEVIHKRADGDQLGSGERDAHGEVVVINLSFVVRRRDTEGSDMVY